MFGGFRRPSHGDLVVGVIGTHEGQRDLRDDSRVSDLTMAGGCYHSLK